MRKIVLVAGREFIETIKTKMYLLTVFVTPVIIVGVIFLAMKLTEKTVAGPRPAKKVAVVDCSKTLSEDLQRVFGAHNRSHAERQIVLQPFEGVETQPKAEELKQAVRERKFDVLLIVPDDVLNGKTAAQYCSRALSDIELYSTVSNLLQRAVTDRRVREHNLSREIIQQVTRGVPVEQVDLAAKVEQKRGMMFQMMVPFFFLFLMFFGVAGTSQFMLTSVIEEKNARIIEVLLSAVSPFQLMAGKILGLVLAGLVQVAVWGIAAYATAVTRGFGHVLTPQVVVYFLIYFLLGFFLFCSLLAAIGSACNSIKETQSLMLPIMMILVLPMIIWFPISQHPNGTLATVLSFIPPITPMIMILRIGVEPELSRLQIIASLLLLAASVPAVMWMSAKIFHTGILMYGKMPTLRELWRWLRYS